VPSLVTAWVTNYSTALLSGSFQAASHDTGTDLDSSCDLAEAKALTAQSRDFLRHPQNELSALLPSP
jgi:hypothetical protein